MDERVAGGGKEIKQRPAFGGVITLLNDIFVRTVVSWLWTLGCHVQPCILHAQKS